MKRGEKMEHSIKAGLMITSASDYNMEICRGANEACKELGIELVIFFGGSVDPNVKFVQSSDYQKANVYAFANYLDLDFLVIPASSICRTDQKTREAFPKYFHIPVVTLNSLVMIEGLLQSKDLQAIKKPYQVMICFLKKSIFYRHLVIILIREI